MNFKIANPHVMRLSAKALSASIALHSARLRLDSGVVAMQATAESYRALRSVHQTVQTDGLSKSLMGLIHHFGGQRFADLPAVESFDLTPLPARDRRAQQVLGALGAALETEGSAIADWLSDTAATTERLLSALSDETDSHVSLAEDALVSLGQISVTADVLQATTVDSIPVTARIEALTVIGEVVRLIDAPEFTADDAGLTMARQALGLLVDKLTPITGAVYRNDAVESDPAARSEAYTPREGTLDGFGYDAERCAQLAEAVLALTGAVRELIARGTGVVEALRNLAAQAATQPTPGEGEEAPVATDVTVLRQVITGWVGLVSALVGAASEQCGAALSDIDALFSAADIAEFDATST